ncbi:polysaccharide deacetylase family protein [Geodermatophilus sp. SYSU D00703]
MSTGLDTLTATTLGLTPRGRRRVAPPLGFARFVLDPDALAALESPLTAADEPYAESPGGSETRPQSLLLTGRLRVDAAVQPLHCRPLFPGRLIFLGGPQASRPSADQVSRSAYGGWNTEGTLMVDLLQADRRAVSPDLLSRWARLVAELGDAIPTRMWYGPVRISAQFLFGAIPQLSPNDAPPPAGNGALSQRHRQRVAEFLRGEWGPVIGPPIRSGRMTDDPVAAQWMPQFVVAADRNVRIRVTAARWVEPFDGPAAHLVAASGVNVAREHPAHPANAAVPARLVYQHVAAANGLRKPLLAACAPSSMRYHRLRITRIWRPERDCSVHFAAQAVRLSRADGTLVVAQRLPAHGLLFHGVPPGEGGSLQLDLTLADLSANSSHRLLWLPGEPKNIAGRTQSNWQRMSGASPITIDLAPANGVHVVARRPMPQAMLEVDPQPFPAPGENRCTYLSMRRATRALVDNRITGGRLSFEDDVTTAATSRLINGAVRPYLSFFGHALSSFRAQRNIPAARRLRPADLLANGSPDPGEVPGRAGWFLPFWEALFPDRMPAQKVNGTRRRTRRMTRGMVAYAIWQSQSETFADPDLTTNFPDAYIARGAPGALVVTGLAREFFLDPPIIEGPDLPDAQRDEMVARIVDRALTTGSMLQYWVTLDGYNSVRTRRLDRHVGHSPVFLQVEPAQGTPTGITVVDQFGQHAVAIQGATGKRRLGGAEVWVAAEWAESSATPSIAPGGAAKLLQVTIDDGPDPVASALTPILAELRRRSLIGAFFVIGQEVEGNPGATKEILRAGHALGNHSWDHMEPSTMQYTDEQVREQFRRTHGKVQAVTKLDMRYWRAPRLSQVDRLTGLLSGPGKLYTLSHCDVHADSKDSQGVTSAAGMLSAIRANIKAKPNRRMFRLLFHVKSETAAALPTVLDGLVADGHTLVDFSQAG